MTIELAQWVKRTVVVMLVRAVGVAPPWKDSAVFCIVSLRIPARDDFKDCGGSVAEYLVGCRFRTRRDCSCGVVGEKSSVVVESRWRS